VNISATTAVAAVAGAPVKHSLSPLIHNAWIEAADLDAVYVAFELGREGFGALARALRGGVLRGLNVTAPFKDEALKVADSASERARRAGAANLLIFEPGGEIIADNTDGEGLLAAFAEQAPDFDPAAGPVVVLGAGGAARGAIAAFVDAGAPEVRLVSRSRTKAGMLAEAFGIPVVTVESINVALSDANAVINATPATPDCPLEGAPSGCVVMDMVYRPLVTPFLARADELGLRRVDGLAMLIGQARPSFAALFGVAPPPLDVRALVLSRLDREP